MAASPKEPKFSRDFLFLRLLLSFDSFLYPLFEDESPLLNRLRRDLDPMVY